MAVAREDGAKYRHGKALEGRLVLIRCVTAQATEHSNPTKPPVHRSKHIDGQHIEGPFLTASSIPPSQDRKSSYAHIYLVRLSSHGSLLYKFDLPAPSLLPLGRPCPQKVSKQFHRKQPRSNKNIPGASRFFFGARFPLPWILETKSARQPPAQPQLPPRG